MNTNFFQRELERLLAVTGLTQVTFAGRAAYVRKDKYYAKIEFITTTVRNHYSAIKVTIFNKSVGVIDTISFAFNDYFKKRHHVWEEDGSSVKWYTKPHAEEWDEFARCVGEYIMFFKD